MFLLALHPGAIIIDDDDESSAVDSMETDAGGGKSGRVSPDGEAGGLGHAMSRSSYGLVMKTVRSE